MNKDLLTDLVKHTYGLGFIDVFKVVGTDVETKIEAAAEDKSVVIQAATTEMVPEFNGIFGMPNLSKLNVILGIPEYNVNATITINRQERNGVDQPVGINFKNEVGDFVNDYRFMTSETVNTKLSSFQFRGAKWNVEFAPTSAAIQRMKYQSLSNKEELTFVAKTEGSNLKFNFGDHSSHAGSFVFQSNVTGKLVKTWYWPVMQVMAILDLDGTKTMKFSDEGIMEIDVVSSHATYRYIIPSLMK